MPSDTQEDFPHQFLSCHWPQEFKSRRLFPRHKEDQPLIEYLQNSFGGKGDDGDKSGESDESEGDESEGDESEGDESEGDESEEDDSGEDEDEEGKGEEETQYGDEKKEKEENQSHQAGDKDAEAWNSRSTIRKFMEGFVGDEETLPYPDQVEKVVDFCEQGRSAESKKYVALLDDTNDGGTGPKKTPYCRPYKGPLTLQKFRKELEKQVLYPISIMHLNEEKLTHRAAFQNQVGPRKASS